MEQEVVQSETQVHEKLQSAHHHQHTNNQLLTGQMPFLPPNQQYQSTKATNIIIQKQQEARDLQYGTTTQ